ncbi:hypothetical protein KPH14_001035, partial [Odynerus spinipes]
MLLDVVPILKIVRDDVKRTSPVAVAERPKFSCRTLTPVAAMTFAGVVVSDEVMLGGDWGGAATAPR